MAQSENARMEDIQTPSEDPQPVEVEANAAISLSQTTPSPGRRLCPTAAPFNFVQTSPLSTRRPLRPTAAPFIMPIEYDTQQAASTYDHSPEQSVLPYDGHAEQPTTPFDHYAEQLTAFDRYCAPASAATDAYSAQQSSSSDNEHYPQETSSGDHSGPPSITDDDHSGYYPTVFEHMPIQWPATSDDHDAQQSTSSDDEDSPTPTTSDDNFGQPATLRELVLDSVPDYDPPRRLQLFLDPIERPSAPRPDIWKAKLERQEKIFEMLREIQSRPSRLLPNGAVGRLRPPERRRMNDDFRRAIVMLQDNFYGYTNGPVESRHDYFTPWARPPEWEMDYNEFAYNPVPSVELPSDNLATGARNDTPYWGTDWPQPTPRESDWLRALRYVTTSLR